jgi:hypothetical protein
MDFKKVVLIHSPAFTENAPKNVSGELHCHVLVCLPYHRHAKTSGLYVVFVFCFVSKKMLLIMFLMSHIAELSSSTL